MTSTFRSGRPTSTQGITPLLPTARTGIRVAFLALCLARLLNLATRFAAMPFAPGHWQFNVNIQKLYLRSLLQALLEVPSYPPDFGARPAPLMTAANRKAYSWSRLTESALIEADSG